MRNDENMPPEGAMVKTIHQRNKSSPALSMAAGGGIVKTGIKRAAFGDVSNIVGLSRPSKDEFTLPTKAGLQPHTKPPQLAAEKKIAAFIRPAQRPMSVSNLRSLLTGGHSVVQQEQNAKAPSIENVGQPQVSNVRKVLTKRATTVFKDDPLDTVQEIDQHVSSNVPADRPTEHIAQPIVQPWPESKFFLPPPLPEAPVQVEPVKDSARPPSEGSLPGIESVTLEPEPLPKPAESHKMIVDPSKISHQPITHVLSQPVDSLLNSYLPDTTTDIRLANAQATNLPRIPALPPALPALEPHAMYDAVRPESEEYWDEEEEEAPDEDGYVTARSFRSKGENTTGGVTTVIFPQVNHRVRKEISAATQLVEATRTPEEIEDESFDTSMVAEYGDEIFEYMRQLEVKMLPNAHYMDNQHEIQWPMRSVLMEWLVQVHHRFNLLPETLFLCVNYIDRFLSCKVVSLGKLQLVGATAIFIAAKYEEINCPSIQEIVYMVDNGYSIDEILKAERFMLTMLQFELGWPGPMSFLRRISKADDYDLETRTLAKYFLEVTLMDERFIGSPPSFVAAASHCLARLMLRKGNWVSLLCARLR
jgi:Cyclin, N-terminal domain/Cyclin, C-terminal domain